MNDVNLNALKIFSEVANSKSFLSASNKLYISQPAVSRSIAKLESDLGCTLFYRTNNGISLTESGEVLFKYVDEISHLLDSCQRVLISLSKDDEGELVIGIRSHLVRNYLMDKINKFCQKYPKVKISLIDNSTKNLIDKLENRSLDFIVDSSPIETVYNNIKIKPINKIKTCFIKSVEYESESKKLIDLEKENLILPASWGSIRKNLDSTLESYNVKLSPKLEFETEELIIDAVRKKLGIGYVLQPAIQYLIDAKIVEIIDYKEALPEIELNLIYIEKNLNNLAKTFFREVLENE